MSDPADLAPSRDPAVYGKRRLFTAGFFVWISLCVMCLCAGAALGRFGWQAPAAKPAPPIQAAASTAAPLAVAPGRIAAPPRAPTPINTPLITIPPVIMPAVTVPAVIAALAAPTGADRGVAERLAKLETQSVRASDAAVDALAAASLSVAAENSGPFDQDLAAYERIAPYDADLAALRPLATQGAPSRAALAAALPALADQAALAARAPDSHAGLLARAWALVGKVFVVRRLDPGGGGVDGTLARAEDQAAAGDIAGAAQTLQALPAPARVPLQDWLGAVARRTEIDRRIASLRIRALGALAAPPAPAGGPS